MKTATNSLTKIVILTAVILAVLTINYIQAAWSGPTDTAPNNNTDAPIHTGADQVKSGGLALGGNSIVSGTGAFGTTTAPVAGLTSVVDGKLGATEYCDISGNNCIAPNSNGITLYFEDFETYGDILNAYIGCQNRGHDGVWASMDGGGTENVICFQSNSVTLGSTGLLFSMIHTHNGNVNQYIVDLNMPKNELYAYARENCNAIVDPTGSISNARWNTTYTGDGQISGLIQTNSGTPSIGSNSQVQSLSGLSVGDSITVVGNTGGCSGEARLKVTLLAE